MLTRKAANAEVLKLNTQLAAISEPTESRKGLRRTIAAKTQQIKSLEATIETLNARVTADTVRLAKAAEQQEQILAAAKEIMTEEAQVEFEIRVEEILK